MEDSILLSTKSVLNLDVDYNAFDLDILTYLNMALSTVQQLGAITDAVIVGDSTATWSSLGLPNEQLSLVKTYVILKTRLLFDPPTASFVLEAFSKQISELEWRLNVNRELEVNV